MSRPRSAYPGSGILDTFQKLFWVLFGCSQYNRLVSGWANRRLVRDSLRRYRLSCGVKHDANMPEFLLIGWNI
jgi:hypothetical protein